MFQEALTRETKKSKKRTDRSESFRTQFPYGIVFLWSLFLGVGAYSVLFSPLLSITKIDIREHQTVGEEEMYAVIETVFKTKRWFIFPAQNLLVVPVAQIENQIKTLSPLIDHVQITRVFPDTIQLGLAERTELLLWCAGGPCVMIDAQGKAWSHEKVFEARYDERRLTLVDTSALPIELGQSLPVKDYIQFFARFREELMHQLGIEVERQATTPSRYSRELRLTTTKGWTLLVDIDIPLDETLLSLKSFLEEQERQPTKLPFTAIDARVPGRIFITTNIEETSPGETPKALSGEKKEE